MILRDFIKTLTTLADFSKIDADSDVTAEDHFGFEYEIKAVEVDQDGNLSILIREA